MCASIKDISHEVLRPFTQVHAFCGISVWGYALRRAGWPDDREVWTGSAPCQPFSVAGKQEGTSDPRHLWPDFFRLIDACRPARLFGEQVSGAAGYAWLDGICADLESKDYACWAFDIPACSVDAPHIRNRLYWLAKYVANADHGRGNERQSQISQANKRPISRWMHDGARRCDEGGAVEHSTLIGRREGWSESDLRRGWDAFAVADASGDVAFSTEQSNGGRKLQRSGKSSGANDQRSPGQFGGPNGGTVGHTDDPRFPLRKSKSGNPREKRSPAQRTDDASFWSDHEWIICHDGKARRTKRSLPLLVAGSTGRIPMWRALGNAICAPLAIEVIRAFMESEQ